MALVPERSTRAIALARDRNREVRRQLVIALPRTKPSRALLATTGNVPGWRFAADYGIPGAKKQLRPDRMSRPPSPLASTHRVKVRAPHIRFGS